ncbi:MAG: TRAP transporter substrate-binding protein [Deltaproteobacteria bacterium]|nr:TRAP transporter substrate-binding protein [Deltaproteobacteria bacterium]
MKKCMFFVFCMTLTAFFGLVSVGTAAEETIELKFAHAFSPKHTMQQKVFMPWADKISEMTNGKVKVTFFPGGALGKTPDHYALAEKGIADIIYILQDYTPGRFPMTSVFELPFMIPSAEKTSVAMWKVFEQFPEFRKEYEKVKVLALFCHPGGHFNTTEKPIRKLEDFQGLKFRTASPHVTKALKIFGAVPVNMPVTETYTALERGVVDGTVLPWEGNFVFKLAELLKYGTEADFYTMTMMVVMNKRKYESLPEDVKQAIDETTGMPLSQEAGRVYDEVRPVMKQLCLKAGMEAIQLPQEEREKLKELTKPLQDEWVKDMEDKGLPGREVLDAALKYIHE